jgi:hypothetical protein
LILNLSHPAAKIAEFLFFPNSSVALLIPSTNNHFGELNGSFRRIEGGCFIAESLAGRAVMSSFDTSIVYPKFNEGGGIIRDILQTIIIFQVQGQNHRL